MEAGMNSLWTDDASNSLSLAAAIRRKTQPSDLVQYALVDAFTDKAFKGNPAAVVLLPQVKDEEWMQQVAVEFNISQTAFLVKRQSALLEGAGPGDEDGHLHANGDRHAEARENGHSKPTPVDNEYDIRWFTPHHEVALCGHATLASSHVLFSTGLVGGDTILFQSKSGELIVRKVEPITGGKQNEALQKGRDKSTRLLELNFPVITTTASDKSEIKSLVNTFQGVDVISVGRSANDDLIVELSARREVENLHPQWHELIQCSGRGLHVTAKDSSQSDIDFVSRCFFPKIGINEDPVCGSAHCALTPFWAAKLGKDSLEAYQVAQGRATEPEKVYITEAKTQRVARAAKKAKTKKRAELKRSPDELQANSNL